MAGVGPDPWQQADPWGWQQAANMYRPQPEPYPASTATATATGREEAGIPPPPSSWEDGEQQGRQSRNYVNGGDTPASNEPAPQRIIHDVPPTWDGSEPERLCGPYLKSLQGWINTTRAQKTQMGMTILHYAHGDLKVIINELEVEELTAVNGAQLVFDHIKKEYHE